MRPIILKPQYTKQIEKYAKFIDSATEYRGFTLTQSDGAHFVLDDYPCNNSSRYAMVVNVIEQLKPERFENGELISFVPLLIIAEVKNVFRRNSRSTLRANSETKTENDDASQFANLFGIADVANIAKSIGYLSLDYLFKLWYYYYQLAVLSADYLIYFDAVIGLILRRASSYDPIEQTIKRLLLEELFAAQCETKQKISTRIIEIALRGRYSPIGEVLGYYRSDPEKTAYPNPYPSFSLSNAFVTAVADSIESYLRLLDGYVLAKLRAEQTASLTPTYLEQIANAADEYELYELITDRFGYRIELLLPYTHTTIQRQQQSSVSIYANESESTFTSLKIRLPEKRCVDRMIIGSRNRDHQKPVIPVTIEIDIAIANNDTITRTRLVRPLTVGISDLKQVLLQPHLIDITTTVDTIYENFGLKRSVRVTDSADTYLIHVYRMRADDLYRNVVNLWLAKLNPIIR